MTHVIPQHVLDSYLTDAGYTAAQKAELEIAYYAMRAKILNDLTPLPIVRPNNKLIMTAGAEGTGKTVYLRDIVDQKKAAGEKIALIYWGEILDYIPSFKNTSSDIAGYFGCAAGGEHHISAASQQWIRGAKWVGDRLLNHFTDLGANIAFETTAHNPHIADFMDNFKRAGYAIDLHFCDAPLDVKKKSAKEQYSAATGTYISPETIETKSAQILGNMPVFAAKADTITVLWRDKMGSKLVPIARVDGAKIEMLSNAGINAFDQEHAGRGITLDAFLKANSHARKPRAAAERVVAPV